MRPFEQILIDLDSGVWSAVSRVVLGFAMLPAFHALPAGDHRALTFPVLFLGMLVALRVVPAVLRHILPFSTDAKAIWAERRNIAKQCDSYQWRKLFWIGLGLLSYTALAGGLKSSELVVTIICLICGGAGLLLWRWARVAVRPQ